jgi:hypothetical protein
MGSLDLGVTKTYYLDNRDQEQKIMYIGMSDGMEHTKEKYYLADNKSSLIAQKNNDILIMYKILSMIVIILFVINALFLIDNFFSTMFSL